MDEILYGLFDAVSEGKTLLLTPNQRLSATLHKLYIKHQTANGKETWLTPNILPLTTWLKNIWQVYGLNQFNKFPLLLSDFQELYLWEEIIKQSNIPLLQIADTAKLVKSAWDLMHQWEVSLTDPSFLLTDDSKTFKGWAETFMEICEKNHWISFTLIIKQLTSWISHSKVEALPSAILLLGFTEFSPYIKRLIDSIKTVSEIKEIKFQVEKKTNAKKIVLSDEKSEIEAMALFAKSRLEHNPNATVACVNPALDKKQDAIVKIFNKTFLKPESFSLLKKQSILNISAGKTLLLCPLVNAAFLLLSLNKKKLSYEKFSALLTSPFIGDAESEKDQRYLYECYLRDKNIHMIELNRWLEREDAAYCKKFNEKLIAVLSFIETCPAQCSYESWSSYFSDLLDIAGWPGERSLNSEEYQMVESFYHLLEQLNQLDTVASQTSYHEALHTLHKMAMNTIFHPKTPNAPIQILGVLEAAGLPFDHIWISGMDDLSWPPKPDPNPFLPKILQRQLNMPHATASRELMFCENIIAQFLSSAEEVIFSYPLQSEQLERNESPLLKKVTQSEWEDILPTKEVTIIEKIFRTRQIEKIIDEKGLSVPEGTQIRGGINVIKQQALCPFRAYAEWRLHAKPLQQSTLGLNGKERGIITHKVLEHLWNKINNYHQLVSLSSSELNSSISKAIEAAFNELKLTKTLRHRYLTLEKERLHTVISDWLEIEKKRPPFKIHRNESSILIENHGLKLSCRIDRIDELENGTKLIIDYKTSKSNDINKWFGDRPEEPQLPIYLLQHQSEVVGISFAEVIRGEAAFKGIIHEELEMAGFKPLNKIKTADATSWAIQMEKWQVIFNKLTYDFSVGVAKVNPKDGEQTCTYCSLKPLCRVNEM